MIVLEPLLRFQPHKRICPWQSQITSLLREH
jgi:hypothetical protein